MYERDAEARGSNRFDLRAPMPATPYYVITQLETHIGSCEAVRRWKEAFIENIARQAVLSTVLAAPIKSYMRDQSLPVVSFGNRALASQFDFATSGTTDLHY